MSNFLVEITVRHASDNLGPMEGTPIIAEYSTNSILDLTDYIQNAKDYFSGMVQFDSNVTYVGMLVQTYQDHHVINIDRTEDGKLRVRTNQ